MQECFRTNPPHKHSSWKCGEKMRNVETWEETGNFLEMILLGQNIRA